MTGRKRCMAGGQDCLCGRWTLHGIDDLGFAGGMNPAAVIVEVGEGADGVEHFAAGKVARVNILDDVAEGGLQIAVAQSEKIKGVGVDSGFGHDAEAVHDRLGAAPVQKDFIDRLALRMAADGAFAGVAFAGGEFGEILLLRVSGFGGGC
jgi:hypothetical protein